MVHICGHCFNLTNLVESQSKADTEIEQHLSQLDDPWLNPIRESGVVSLMEFYNLLFIRYKHLKIKIWLYHKEYGRTQFGLYSKLIIFFIIIIIIIIYII